MKKSHLALINYLLNCNQPMSSKKIAGVLNVSSKSIINYINEINAQQEIIFFSKDGYWIDKEKSQQLIKENNSIPQDFDERVEYIIKELLMLHNDSINIYKLCDNIFVSYSTIKNDIAKMNQQFQNLNIRFILKNNQIMIEGSEQAKRKLMSSIIYQKYDNVLNIKSLNECFPNVEVSKLVRIISECLNKHNYYLNDFSKINLIMHYSIIIDRMKAGHAITNSEHYELTNINSAERALIDDLSNELSASFNLQLSQNEINELLITIRANAQKTELEKSDIFKNQVDESIISYINQLIYKLKDYYYLDLRDDQFIVPFSLHLKNLLERIRYNTMIKNPLSEQLKESSPILLDIALFISKDICEYFNIKEQLSFDEICFIAIHIGAQIDRENDEQDKIKVILVCPSYMHLAAAIRNKLLYNLGTKIVIVNTVNSLEEVNRDIAEAYITTFASTESVNVPHCIISPFVSDSDIAKIYDLISDVKNKRNLYLLNKDFFNFFSSENFIVTDQIYDKNQAMHIMAENLRISGCVDKDYEKKVLLREESSPTSFYSFAIPHSFEMDAIVSRICVMILKKPIAWNHNQVNIVLMIAMNKKDNTHFYQLFEAIIDLFTNEKISNLISNVESFEDFKNVLTNY